MSDPIDELFDAVAWEINLQPPLDGRSIGELMADAKSAIYSLRSENMSLKMQVEQLGKAVFEIEKMSVVLYAKIKRLREAGEKMAERMEGHARDGLWENADAASLAAWRAASKSEDE